MSKYDDRPYLVGKGKPPKEHRFRKGQSGNPRGRPRKANRKSVLRELLIEVVNEEIEVRIGGKTVRITKKEAALIAMANDMLEGTPAHRLKAFRELSKFGAFDVPPAEIGLPHEQAKKFVERLAEEVRRQGLWDAPEFKPDQ